MLTDTIAKLIEQMLEESGGALELQRNEMATRIGCVPSQISYVITSRFTPERGYVIESRRGGGGCIRIVKKQMQRNEYLMHVFCAVGKAISERATAAYLQNLSGSELITEREAKMIRTATSDSALSHIHPTDRDTIRADIFRHIILSIIN